MSEPSECEAAGELDSGQCLARSVLDALTENPALEAVTINRARQTISVATLGKTDIPKLTDRISATVQRAQEAGAGYPCTLLAGEGDCLTCAQPLSEFERRRITIRYDVETTTISRVTCVTAPKFWRWRDIPWPRFVPRELVLPDEADHEHEWKLQLLAATLCGVSGLTAYWIGEGPGSAALYVLAYVAGSWFTVHEIRELLQKRALDVHFLMLV